MVQGEIEAQGQYMLGNKNGIWLETGSSDSLRSNNCLLKAKHYADSLTLQYPAIAVKNGISGDVIIKYKLSEDSALRDITFIKSLGYGCNSQSLKYVINNPKKNPYDSQYYTDTISFRIH